MKIAFVKFKYVPFGGGEGYLDRLMEGCRIRGHEVHLLTTEWPEQKGEGLKICILPVPTGGFAKRVRAFSKAVAEQHASGAFDAVFSLERTAVQDVWRSGEGVHAVWLQRRRLFEPGWKVSLSAGSKRHRALLDLEADCVDKTPLIICNSAMVRGDILQAYGRSEGIEVVHNGFYPSRFNLDNREQNRLAVRTHYGIPPGAPLALFAGSGFERKGLPQWLEVLPELKGVHTLVLGRDPAAPWMKRAARLGVSDRIVFAPPRDDLKACFHAADLALLPSWFDPFPNAGLEALACGTPLLTSTYSGVCECIRAGENGAVIDQPSNLEALRREALHWLKDPLPPETVSRIAASVADKTMAHNLEQTLNCLDRFRK